MGPRPPKSRKWHSSGLEQIVVASFRMHECNGESQKFKFCIGHCDKTLWETFLPSNLFCLMHGSLLNMWFHQICHYI